MIQIFITALYPTRNDFLAAISEFSDYAFGNWPEGEGAPVTSPEIPEIVQNNLVEDTDWEWIDQTYEDYLTAQQEAADAAAEAAKIAAWTADANLWHNEVVRPERERLLRLADKYQGGVYWAELTSGEQTEFETWRTAMKNITVTYPTYVAEITWPTMPSFFDIS